MGGISREMTVVRIPLKSAKHHFGVSLSRGTRPYNEDSYQAGTIEIPAFAKRRPMSLTRSANGGIRPEITPTESASGDPQVFYFGVFDGHGGSECADFLREELHNYVEEAMRLFELESSLKRKGPKERYVGWSSSMGDKEDRPVEGQGEVTGRDILGAIKTHTPPGVEPLKPPKNGTEEELPTAGANSKAEPLDSAPPLKQSQSIRKAEELER